MEKQKNNLRRLAVLDRLFDLNNFYSIEQTSSNIKLQGYYNSDIVKKAYKLKFDSDAPNFLGHVWLQRGIYRIVLT